MNDVLLDHRDLLRRHLHPQIAARHHHAIRHLEDFIQMFERLRLFELGDDRHVSTVSANELLYLANVGGGAHE